MMNCNEIEEVIKELLPLLKKYNTGDMSYYIDQLSTVLDILNSNISITEKNQELYKIGKKLFPARGGLTDEQKPPFSGAGLRHDGRLF